MKKLLLSLSLAFIATAFVNAQDYVWNFGQDQTTFPVTASRQPVETISNLTIFQGETSSAPIVNMGEIRSGKKNFNGIEYVQRFQFNGAGYAGANVADEAPLVFMPTQRYISFPVNGDCVIKGHIITGSSSTARKIFVTDGESLVGVMAAPEGNDAVETTVKYTGKATTLYMFCNSACNMYYLEVKGDTPSSIKQNNADKVVASVSYFDLLGRQVNETTKGTLIKKVIYEDSSVETTKVYVQ